MKKLVPALGIVLLFSLIHFPEISATTSVANLEAFTSSGITFNQHGVSGPYENYFEVDSIEKLYMIRFFRNSGFILIRDLDFTDDSSYLSAGSGFLQGNFDGDTSTVGSIKDQLTSGRGWLPVNHGSSSSRNNFNGDGNTISNLLINNPVSSNGFAGGIFYDLRGDANVSLKFENITFSGVNASSSNQKFGVIAGNTAFVDYYNVQILGQLTSTYSGACDGSNWAWVGGIAGISSANVNVIDTGINLEISANSCAVGGMFGQYRNGIISNSFFHGTITNPRLRNGGFIGNLSLPSSSEPSIIKNSFSSVVIHSTNTSNGGIIGTFQSAASDFELLNVYSIGFIQGGSSSAGMIGGSQVPDLLQTKLKNSFSATVMLGNSTRQYLTQSSDFINATVHNNFVFSDIDASNRTNAFDGVSITTSGNLFLRSWHESILGSGSSSWYMLHSINDNLPYLPVLLRSGIYEPLNNQPIITSTNISNFDESGLIRTANLLDAVNFSLEPSSFTVDYISNGGSILNQEIVSNGSSITSNPQTIREGYLFEGWYSDPELTTLYDFNTVLTTDITLYAKWTLTTFTLSFDSGPGSEVSPVSGNEGQQVSLPTPTLQDHRFDGWLNSAGQLVSNPYTMTNVNETFTAKWTFVTFSPITRRPLERELFLLVEGGGVFEYGDPIPFPSVTALERFGSIESDLSGNVIIDGEIGEEIGRYELSFTLSYNGETVVETLVYEIVDTVPPVLTVSFPERIFLNQSVEPVITVSDNAPGDVTVRVVKDLDVSRIGTQLFIIEAVDASGNTTQLIEEVQVLFPEVRQRSVQVNAQRFLFVIQEHLMDFASMVLYMAQSVIEPAINSPQWEVFEEREFVAQGPGERVYLMMMDALGNVISRESIELFWAREPQVMRDQIVYPDIQTSSIIPWGWIGGLTLGSLTIASVGWFVWKRKSNDSSQ
jgi:uncharacterized repeat protein (TIGR02543 family)